MKTWIWKEGIYLRRRSLINEDCDWASWRVWFLRLAASSLKKNRRARQAITLALSIQSRCQRWIGCFTRWNHLREFTHNNGLDSTKHSKRSTNSSSRSTKRSNRSMKHSKRSTNSFSRSTKRSSRSTNELKHPTNYLIDNQTNFVSRYGWN